MKKIIYSVVILLTIISCKKDDFVTFSGKITNKNSDSLIIANPQKGYRKVIQLDESGAFKDTLKVAEGFLSIFDGKEFSSLYLKNGSQLSMTYNATDFFKTLQFSGGNASENNFLTEVALNQETFFEDETMFSLPKTDFEAKMSSFITNFKNSLNKSSTDTTFISLQKGYIENFEVQLGDVYKEKNYLLTKLVKGAVSPKFVDYENHKGGTTSLDDLKGKYVYIDLWATWCQPCKMEIPHLQKIEQQFHNKNIEFVSISIDYKKDHDTWQKMIDDNKMTGVQLYANEDKEFAQGYRVTTIPRFILIDPEGKIVNSDAPRPSSAELVTLLESLNI